MHERVQKWMDVLMDRTKYIRYYIHLDKARKERVSGFCVHDTKHRKPFVRCVLSL